MMECAYCHEQIADDACFCDLCGDAVTLCATCGVPRKGRRCTECGGVLMPREKPDPSNGSNAAKPCSARPAIGAVDAEPNGGEASMPPPPEATPTLRLVNRNLPADLKLTGTTLIGRDSGPYSITFAQHGHVSGKHCEFSFHTPGGWVLVDIGSTNGTSRNGNTLLPHQACTLANGDMIKIANIEFEVILED